MRVDRWLGEAFSGAWVQLARAHRPRQAIVAPSEATSLFCVAAARGATMFDECFTAF